MDMDEPEPEVFRPLPPPPPLPKLRRRRAWRATSAFLPAPPRKTMRLEPDDVGNNAGGVEELIQEAEEQRAEEASTSSEIPQASVDEEEERREEERSGLNRSQRILYCASFLCHFGIPASVTPFLDDLASIMSDRAAPRRPISNEIDLFIRAMWAKYDYRTRYFCCECDRSLPDMSSRCSNGGCRLRGLALKRGKATKRVTIHTVSILPQLQIVLKRVLDKLIEVHRRIHVDGCNRLRTEISYFPAYEADIETFLEFLSKEIRVVLTLNFDGVVFKKLTRSQAWPIYIRLEGLPYRIKNHASNMLIAGVMFLRKTPTETLLKELFSVRHRHRIGNHSLEQRIVATQLREARINVQEIREVQRAISDLPCSSDIVVKQLAELLKKSAAITTGLATVVDSLLVAVPKMNKNIVHSNSALRHSCVRKTPVPDEATLSFGNLTKDWIVPSCPPFKQFNLNSLLQAWVASGRSRGDDHVSQCTHFLRRYFSMACDPPKAIKRYACRVTGMHAKTDLLDLPEDVFDIIIGCLLDGLNIGQADLSRTADELKKSPTEFWLRLGNTDRAREENFTTRQRIQAVWRISLRESIAKALNAMRQYVEINGRLVPKRKNCPTDAHRATSSRSGDDTAEI